MAREYIKTGANVYTPIGDTQGLVVPQGADSLAFVPQAVASMAAGGSIYFKPQSVTFARGISIDADGLFPVKAGDVFIVKFPMMNYTGTSAFNAIVSQLNASKATIVGEAQAFAGEVAGHCWMPCVSYMAIQDGFCRLLAWVGSAISDIAFTRGYRGNECVITKISQLMPNIVANRGALVSGGAFQFDEGGNAFALNYPPIGEEWRVGKWFDEKPIYLQVFQTVSSATLPGGSSKNIGVAVERVIKSEPVLLLGNGEVISVNVYTNALGDVCFYANARRASDANGGVIQLLTYTTAVTAVPNNDIWKSCTVYFPVWYTKAVD